MMKRFLCAAWLVFLGACASELPAPIDSASQAIVGGVPVGVCGFPTTVLVGNGCTGTLIHPRVVVTAAHCGNPRTVGFGERLGDLITRTVRCTTVPGRGVGADVQFCVLDEPMQDLPITPVLYGCELAELDVGDDVVITGFGLTAFNTNTGGIQRWSPAPIRDIREEITLIGTPQASACPGDSGGPVFLRMNDGSWRVFGTVSGGTTGIPCNGDGAYPRIERFVPWFEDTSGIDITPCHDADGTWNPGPECTGFFAGDHTGGQAWANQCLGAPRSGPSSTCGAPFGPPPPIDAGIDAGTSIDAGAIDAGAIDAGAIDAGADMETDAALLDRGVIDSGAHDAGPLTDMGAIPDAAGGDTPESDGSVSRGDCSAFDPSAPPPLLLFAAAVLLRRRYRNQRRSASIGSR